MIAWEPGFTEGKSFSGIWTKHHKAEVSATVKSSSSSLTTRPGVTLRSTTRPAMGLRRAKTDPESAGTTSWLRPGSLSAKRQPAGPQEAEAVLGIFQIGPLHFQPGLALLEFGQADGLAFIKLAGPVIGLLGGVEFGGGLPGGHLGLTQFHAVDDRQNVPRLHHLPVVRHDLHHPARHPGADFGQALFIEDQFPGKGHPVIQGAENHRGSLNPGLFHRLRSQLHLAGAASRVLLFQLCLAWS